MITGRMHNASVVHIGRKVKTVNEYTLYAPFCQKIGTSTVAYLGETHEEVTCKKCQRLLTTKPHLFRAS
jgi:hypothetical protein